MPSTARLKNFEIWKHKHTFYFNNHSHIFSLCLNFSLCHSKIFSMSQFFPCVTAKIPVFSLFGKSKNQIPCFPCAVATLENYKNENYWAERCPIETETHGVFTLAWSGTGTGTGTSIMQNLSHCTGTWKNGLYGFNKNLSHCTWTGTGKNTSIHHRAHFQDLKNGYQTHSSGPENVLGVLPCPCSGAVWKVLIKTIQPILPGPCPCLGPGSGPSQCEYTIRLEWWGCWEHPQQYLETRIRHGT